MRPYADARGHSLQYDTVRICVPTDYSSRCPLDGKIVLGTRTVLVGSMSQIRTRVDCNVHISINCDVFLTNPPVFFSFDVGHPTASNGRL